MYLISVLTLLLWHSFCFFLLWSLHTSWVLLLLICHTFILSSLIFCPYYLYPAQLDSTPSSFSWCGIFVLKSEIQYTNFDSLLSQDCFSTTRTYCCLLASTLELDSVAHASSFSGCSHLSPLHLLLGRPESLVIWSSENPYCLPSASP